MTIIILNATWTIAVQMARQLVFDFGELLPEPQQAQVGKSWKVIFGASLGGFHAPLIGESANARQE